MSTYQSPIYIEQGAAQEVVTSTGSIRLEDNGKLYFGTGSAGVGDIALYYTGTQLKITGLPTEDPGVAGALWLDSAVLTVSAGT